MKNSIFLAAGGTGGHIYPAIAVAKALTDQYPQAKILFWGATKGLENEIVPRYGYPLYQVKMGRLNHNVSRLERLMTLFLLPLALLKALFVLLKVRPSFVMGFGGHASAPLLLAASFLRIPSYIWEPNALPGLANRKLSSFVDEAFVVFEKAKKHIKCPSQDFGLPIRKEVEEPRKKELHSTFNVLVYGGSQGSQSINRLVSEIVKGEHLSDDIRFKLQTGKNKFSSCKKELEGVKNIEVLDYIHDMASAYAWADMTIARAGTGTLSELSSVSMPSLLIPLPSAADNHQFENAKSLSDRQAAILLEEKNVTAAGLAEQIQELKNNKESLLRLSQNIKSFYKPNAAEKMATYLLNKNSMC